MVAAIIHCQLKGGEVDGPERAAALKRTFEYIENKLCDVTLVFGVHEEPNSQSYDYLVLLFSDGRCQCRTLQVQGLIASQPQISVPRRTPSRALADGKREGHTREVLAALRRAKVDRGGSPRGGSRNNGGFRSGGVGDRGRYGVEGFRGE